MTPLAFWTASRAHYRSMGSGQFAYVKLAGGDPSNSDPGIFATWPMSWIPATCWGPFFLINRWKTLYQKQNKVYWLLCSRDSSYPVVSGCIRHGHIWSQKKMKEIAIRKVWGATVPQILQLFSTPILKNHSISGYYFHSFGLLRSIYMAKGLCVSYWFVLVGICTCYPFGCF
jgi:hypothetical protein